jgi:hypothetical protein
MRSAIARPIPREDPVMSATFPATSNNIKISVSDEAATQWI